MWLGDEIEPIDRIVGAGVDWAAIAAIVAFLAFFVSLMTFRTPTPRTCGIVEIDQKGIVRQFHEKVDNPPGNLASAAVFLIEPDVLDWMAEQSALSDFSSEVLPNFLGRIATWENEGIHTDIGTPQSLKFAQSQKPYKIPNLLDASWKARFLTHSIHELLENT